MKRILWLLTALSISLMTFGQEEAAGEEENADGWKKGATMTLNFSQVAMDNWSAGGDNAISGNALFNGFANYTKGKSTWDNTLILGYGLQKTGDADWYKNNDEIHFSSKYGREATNNWYYSGLIDFKSQFSKGYEEAGDDTYLSNFFAPAYLSVALGMDYKPNDNLSVMLSPLSGKFTFVYDDSLSNIGAFGVDEGDNFRAEMGAYVKVSYKVELMENISYTTTLDLFSNYFNNPQNIDIDWANLLTFKINDYFNATLTFNMIYDDDITFDETNASGDVIKSVPKVQWKEMFCLGFTYSF